MLTTGILIYCTCHFSSVSFVYLASVCRSVQYLTSALTQAGGGVSCLGCLFSCAVGRAGRCRQTSPARVGSTRSVPATRGLPPPAACVLSPSTLLRLQAALQGAGPVLCALPRPKQLRFSFSGTPQRPRLGWACPVQAAQAARSLTSAVHLIPSAAPASVPGKPVPGALCLFSGASL